MTARELFVHLRMLDVELSVDGPRLNCNAPAGVLTPELRVQIATHKLEIIALLKAPARNRERRAPLSFAQERMWVLDQLQSGAGAYNIPGGVRLEGNLDIAALERAINEVIARHEVLRTTYAAPDGEPVQIVHPATPVVIPIVDLQSHGVTERAAAVADWTRREAGAAFDLNKGPVVRVRILRLAADDHILLATTHHIAADGWSMGLFVREFTALYAAFVRGDASPVAPLDVQYADYAQWQRTHEDSDTLATQLAYWSRKLAAPLPVLDLPADRVRPALQSFAGADVHGGVPASVAQALREFAKTENTTMFIVLLAALNVWLHKMTGATDMCVGTPVAGRSRLAVENLIGFFVNTLVIRSDLRGQPSFREVVARTRATAHEAFANADAPFERVVETLDPPRDRSRNPLFQVMLTYQRADVDALALPGIRVSAPDPVSGNAAKFDLSAEFRDAAAGLELRLEYATALFDRTTVDAFAARFLTLLGNVIANPDEPMATLDVLPAPERARLEQWSRGPAVEREHVGLHELIERQVDLTPDAPAVTFEDDVVTYRSLDARANQVAHALRGHGVGPDTLVGVCMERSVELVVALLGVLKAGGAYVPLDPGLPPDRLAYMIADSEPTLVLVQNHLREVLPAGSVTPLTLADPEVAAAPVTRLANAVAHDQLAYMIYTSGSTGRPKGALNTHRGIVNRLLWMQEAYGLTPDDVVLQKTPFSFDVSVWEFFWPLITGAALVVARPDAHRDPDYLVDLIRRTHVTTLHFVPSMLSAFLGAPAVNTCASLRRVMASGEALTADLQDRFHAQLRCELHNLYGPTEAAVDVTAWACRRDDQGHSVPIGSPIANTQIHVLDADGERVPIGAAGELCIGGSGVGRGYHRRPELTAEKFVPDTFSTIPGARLYRTGDLVRYRRDGILEYLGRLDFQVKVRGFRVELGEIEAALLEAGGVTKATVLAREDTPGDQRIVAYVVAQPDTARVSDTVLRTRLSAKLPEYMVPAHVVFLDDIPVSPTGKVDRSALPLPGKLASLTGRAFTAPATPTEVLVATLWTALLNVPRVGRDDNFFELGGHSLSAVKLVERMRRAGITVDVRTVFLHPTLASLAAAIDEPGASATHALHAHTSSEARIPPGCASITPEMLPLVDLTQTEIDRIVAMVEGGVANVQDIYPLAPQQEGLLFHRLVEGAAKVDTYQMRNLMSIDTRDRVDQLLAALQATVDRHDALRTSIHWDGISVPVQVVQRTATLPVHVVNLNDGERASDALLRLTDPRTLRLDFARPPLMVAFVARDQRRWCVAIACHHIVIDNVSLDVMLGDIKSELDGVVVTHSPAPPYRSFVEASLATPVAAHEAYFREMLAGVDEPTLVFDTLDVRTDGAAIAETHVPLSAELSRRIRVAATQNAVTPAVLFHLAWGLVAARCSRRDDVVFGTVLLGRSLDLPGIERMVGMLINTLPIRLSLRGASVLDAARETYARLAALMPHEQAALVTAQRCSSVPPKSPLFNSLLNYRRSAHAAAPGDAGAEVVAGMQGLLAERRTNYPFVVNVDDMDEAFDVTVQCTADVGPHRLAEYVVLAMDRIATALQAAPHVPVLSLDIIPESERAQREAWNRTERAYDSGAGVHGLIDRQVDKTPDAVALAFDNVDVTYADLDARANRVANALRARGVGRGALVGVCIDRSPDLLAALLGVLKAGAAYVPIDPGLPQDRVAYMLGDAQVGAVLLQRRLAPFLSPLNAVLVTIDEPNGEVEMASIDRPPNATGATDLAYVIHTSGSTGRPKGVAVTHGAVMNVLQSMEREPGLSAGDVLAAVTTVSFDIAGLELFLPLMVGARIELVSREDVLDGAALANRLKKSNATVMQSTPSLWRVLVDAGWQGGPTFRAWSGGESLPRDLANELLARAGEVWNLYGPTETTIWSTVDRVMPGEGAVPIGRPIANTHVDIRDADARHVPVGVSGQLWIGGAGVATGYHRQPDLTAEKFVATDSGGRMYLTGDLARWRGDGRLEHLGRLDFQVKLRGYRIELGEIESVLREHAAVQDAVAMVREERKGDQRLTAYVVLKTGAAARSADLREAIARSLPPYMIPGAIVQLERLPRTPNGKLDRRALPAPDTAEATSAHGYVAPRSEHERLIAELLTDLLGVERVGANDDFFELGGHSILATRVASWIRERFAVEFPVYALFEGPTVAAIAARLDEALQTAARDADVAREELEL